MISAHDPFSQICFTWADQSTKAFEDALKRHSNQHPKDHVAKKFTTIDKQSWGEVLKEILASQQTEKSRASKKTARTGRAIENTAATLNAWIKVLPSGNDYLAVCCGALGIIFGAAESLGNARGIVESTLQSLSDTVERTAESLEIFKNDGKLLKKAENLYVAILDAAEAMLKWQNGNPLKKFGKAVLMQDTYADKLKSKADAISRCGEDFREQFQISANRTVANTDKNVTGMHESMVVAFNQLSKMIMSIAIKADWTVHNQHIILRMLDRPLPPKDIAPEDVLNCLEVNPGHSESDIRTIMQRDNVHGAVHNNTVWILHDERFTTWFKSLSSDIILINGNESPLPRSFVFIGNFLSKLCPGS